LLSLTLIKLSCFLTAETYNFTYIRSVDVLLMTTSVWVRTSLGKWTQRWLTSWGETTCQMCESFSMSTRKSTLMVQFHCLTRSKLSRGSIWQTWFNMIRSTRSETYRISQHSWLFHENTQPFSLPFLPRSIHRTVARFLSTYLSATSQYSVQMAKPIIKIFCCLIAWSF